MAKNETIHFDHRLCRLHVCNFTFQHFKALQRLIIALLCSLTSFFLGMLYNINWVTGDVI